MSNQRKRGWKILQKKKKKKVVEADCFKSNTLTIFLKKFNVSKSSRLPVSCWSLESMGDLKSFSFLDLRILKEHCQIK
jgi:hypothetical protein